MNKRRKSQSTGNVSGLDLNESSLLEELCETEAEAELAFQELVAMLLRGKPLRGSTDWEPGDIGGDYE